MIKWTEFSARGYFYPRPPRGGRPAMPPEQIEPVRISIHALREEGDSRCLALFHLPAYFYPRPPRGGRPLVLKLRPVVLEISIHALREEGDRAGTSLRTSPSDFYPRPPRGGRRDELHGDNSPEQFLSTPSARRATYVSYAITSVYWNFYPRPPRGGRPLPDGKKVLWDEFLSTPSARRATRTAVGYRLKSIISIHALREEGDAIGVETHRQVTEFLSTPSARRATASVRGFEPSLYNFYPRPPRGGRPAPWNCTTEIA